MADDSWNDELGGAHWTVSPSLLRDLRKATASRRNRAPARQDGLRAGKRVGKVAPDPTARVIIELNQNYVGGHAAALAKMIEILRAAGATTERLPQNSGSLGFVAAEIDLSQIEALASVAGDGPHSPLIRISKDEPLRTLLSRSTRTINAEPCWTQFGAHGEGIVVAVADSGIDGDHPHFAMHQNLDLPQGIEHRDFTGSVDGALRDGKGHGTHVAGIVAGETDPSSGAAFRITRRREADDSVATVLEPMTGDPVRGVAPKAKLVSLKVIDASSNGYASMLIAALEHVYEVNQKADEIQIHCVNISMGHGFDASEFGAGLSPLCTVVNRLCDSGVVVVAAAGNDGSAMILTEAGHARRIGLGQSINDPGNADCAITVGSTHAEFPFKHGVSYFSSRGPTVDGRPKPDLIAPGERILSCASAQAELTSIALLEAGVAAVADATYFREESGTSMAAPHVAGAVAAILSVRPAFVGQPMEIKRLLLGSCTDLNRVRDFQGAGLLDVQQALQSI